MVDYVALVETAKRLISENGRAITLLQFDSAPASASQPWKGANDPRDNPDETLSLDAVFVEPSGAVRLGLSSKDSDLIKRSKQIMIVAPGISEDVTVFHEVVDGGTNWKIVGVEVLRPGNEIVLAYIGVSR